MDDNCIARKGDEIWRWYLEKLGQRYEYKLGPLSLFLGVKFTFNPDETAVTLSLENQIRKMLKTFGMEQCKPLRTPFEHGFTEPSLADSPQTEEEKAEMEGEPYMEMVGHLSYIENAGRLDITYAVKIAWKTAYLLGQKHHEIPERHPIIRLNDS